MVNATERNKLEAEKHFTLEIFFLYHRNHKLFSFLLFILNMKNFSHIESLFLFSTLQKEKVR